jgi:hypothetical protein
MEWAPLRSPPLWRAHDMFESLDVSLRVEGKSSPDGVLFCRLDLPGNLPRIERSAVGNGFNLHRGPILNSISFGVYALRSECRDVVNGANAAGDPDRRPSLLGEFNVQGARHSHVLALVQWSHVRRSPPRPPAQSIVPAILSRPGPRTRSPNSQLWQLSPALCRRREAPRKGQHPRGFRHLARW